MTNLKLIRHMAIVLLLDLISYTDITILSLQTINVIFIWYNILTSGDIYEICNVSKSITSSFICPDRDWF